MTDLPDPPLAPRAGWRHRWPLWSMLAVAVAIGSAALVTERSMRQLVSAQRALDDAQTSGRLLMQLMGQLLLAESGQRGYLLTGSDMHLQPYHAALALLDGTRRELSRRLDLQPVVRGDLDELDKVIAAKLDELQRGVALRAAGSTEQSASTLATAEGRRLLDDLRELTTRLLQHQQDRIAVLQADHAAGVSRSYWTAALSFAINVALLAMLLRRMVNAGRQARLDAQAMRARNVELSELLASSAAQNQRMHDLSELGRFLQSSRDADEVTALLAQRLPSLLRARCGALYLFAASRNQLRRVFSWGAEGFVELVEPLDCWALRRGQPFAQPADGGAASCVHLHEGGFTPRPGMLCLPMAAHGELSGLLVIEPEGPTGSRDADLERIQRQTAVEQIALTLGNLALRESLRQQSIRDALTGLYNRRFLEASAQRELARAARRAQDGDAVGVAVLMIDVDHFKRFNDQHGHEVGDQVLRAVAQVLAKSTRGSDVAARYGGEEFTVVLSELTPGQALQRAEALRQAVEAMVPTAGGAVTVSIGVACHPQDGQTLEALLARADQALYAAKRGGRNRVSPASAAGEPAPPATAAP